VVISVPGKLISITPPYAHMQVLLAVRAGWPAIKVVETGIHGVSTGTQGIGVRTPSAAAVADATSGFESVEHMPNVAILTISEQSMVAAGRFSIITIASGNTLSGAGTIPNEHCVTAPATAAGSGTADSCVVRRHRFDPFMDAVNFAPVVVITHVTVRSPEDQLRTDGKRYV
jgi:hypothetical protein